jgi:hypothetical protein
MPERVLPDSSVTMPLIVAPSASSAFAVVMFSLVVVTGVDSTDEIASS